MCILELVEKFVGGWVVVISDFSVLLWSKPFSLSLSFGLGPSRTKIKVVLRLVLLVITETWILLT